MKVLVIGKGGREHALAEALRSLRELREFLRGNAGTAIEGINVAIEVNEFKKLVALRRASRSG